MSNDINSIKRRKTNPSVGLIDLPDHLLGIVVEYLVVPSQALLAVALTASASSPVWHYGLLGPEKLSLTTMYIMSHGGNIYDQHLLDEDDELSSSSDDDEGESSDGTESNLGRWGKVDYRSLEKRLVRKLTDKDVGAVLACIRLAGGEIKRLGLGCLNITGRGLESLRGSTSLEQIDLYKCFCRISLVTSILESIVDVDGSSLKHITMNSDVLGVVVEGCGTEEINGVYTRSGRYDGVAKYTKSVRYNGKDEEFSLFRCHLTDNTRRWYISIVPNNSYPGTTKDIDFYAAVYLNHHGKLPPKEYWMTVPNTGSRNPAPVVSVGWVNREDGFHLLSQKLFSLVT